MQIKISYEDKTNTQLITMAVTELNEITDEAIGIIVEELNKRHLLTNDIQECMNLQMRDLTNDEVLCIARQVMTSSCPICNAKNVNFNIIEYIKGMLFAGIYETKEFLLCKDCLIKEFENAERICGSAVLGGAMLLRLPAVSFSNQQKKDHVNHYFNEPTMDLLTMTANCPGEAYALSMDIIKLFIQN